MIFFTASDKNKNIDEESREVKIRNRGGFIDPTVKMVGAGTLILSKGSEIRANTVLEFGNGTLKLGPKSVIGYGCVLQLHGSITLGKGVLVGPNSCIISSSHQMSNDKPIRKQPLLVGEVVFEDDIWIGANTTINWNTRIGKGSVIGANSFVNKDIPQMEVWAGTPCKRIKKRC